MSEPMTAFQLALLLIGMVLGVCTYYAGIELRDWRKRQKEKK